jgi:mono/diheme cytochrome c family protein
MNRVLLMAVVVVVASCAPESTTGTNPGGGGGGPVEQQKAPLSAFRPVVGGHLMVSADGTRVVVTDPEREQLRILNASTGELIEDVALPVGSWPTRAIEVAPDTYQVLFRATGRLATVTRVPGQAATVTATDVCSEPRSLVRDGAHNETVVACAGGELVHVGTAGNRLEKSAFEWRDVALKPDGSLIATSFRSAELVNVSSVPVATKLDAQRVVTDPANPAMHVAQVAWRMARTDTATVIVHQLHADQLTTSQTTTPNNPVPQPDSSPYGGGGNTNPIPGLPPPCSSAAVVTGVTRVLDTGESFTAHTNDILPVDAALSPDGSMLAIAGAGGSGLSVYPTALVQGSNGCMTPTGGVGGLSLTSVAWLSNTKILVLETLRSSPMVFDLSTGLARPLGAADRPLSSPAHSLFHQSPRGGAALACASCHPEGGEDGHLWVIDGQLRRTQSLAGGVMARAPFHWRGDLNNLSALMTDTFVKRMGATPVTSADLSTLGSWLDTIPASKPSRILTLDQRAAGLAAFQKAACGTCHLSNGTVEGPAADIGTGEAVRSPSLQSVSFRAPFLHTGEIPDLRTRVTGNLHPNHGNLAALDSTEKESLIAYLESL